MTWVCTFTIAGAAFQCGGLRREDEEVRREEKEADGKEWKNGEDKDRKRSWTVEGKWAYQGHRGQIIILEGTNDCFRYIYIKQTLN